MYLRNPDMLRLAGPPLAEPPAKPYKPPITNGGQFIREDDADKVLTILSGPSPYQKYIQPILAAHGSKLPKKFLQIISSVSEAPEHLRGRFVTVNNKVVGGTIDRATGTIYMLPPPGRRSDTRLEFALHEAVHLFAHPFMSLVDERTFQSRYGRSCRAEDTVGTFQRKFCTGLGEGLTQLITEHIMNEQGISKTKYERPYKDFLPTVIELIKIFSVEDFARAYFLGQVNELVKRMEFRWGGAWQNVANLSTPQPQMALAEIKKLEREFLMRKGDFPSRSQLKKYAGLAAVNGHSSPGLGNFGLVKTAPRCPPFRIVCDPGCPLTPTACKRLPKDMCDRILGAVALAETSAAKLEATPLAADTVMKFRQIFGQSPLDPWEIPGRPSRTMAAGRMVAARLRMVARELRDQDTLYRCVSPTRCTYGTSPGGPGGPTGPAPTGLRGIGIIDPGIRPHDPDFRPDPRPDTRVDPGGGHPTQTNVIDPVAVALLCRNEVWLCPGFWRMKKEWQEGTLLHEMLHLCYGVTCAWFQHDQKERRRNNAHCYEALALAVIGKAPEPITNHSCQKTPI